jgi:ribose transport system ATP-binding protein
MLGRRPGRLFAQAVSQPSDRLRMVVRDLTVPGRLSQVDLELREGEILGIGGLQGQGQGELLLALYGGLQSRGQFLVDGRQAKLGSPRDALAAGVALVPEDRKREGLLLSKSVRQNVSLATLHRFTRLGLLQLSREDAAVRRVTADLQVQSNGLDQLAGQLSGGNQQKLVLAKALLTEARVLLLYDPTRGVDVGTKAQIFQLMRDLAAEGYSFVFYSTDLQELVEMSDRIAVMSEGRIVTELDGADMTEEQILRAAMGTSG